MRAYRCMLVAVAGLVIASSGHAATRDYTKLTCGNFLASGTDNMAVLLWWLRGYHAGKSGNAPFESTDQTYARRLGFYCGSHRAENLIDTSERILNELDRGI
jgi:acid stress chaperone HdeB